MPNIAFFNKMIQNIALLPPSFPPATDDRKKLLACPGTVVYNFVNYQCFITISGNTDSPVGGVRPFGLIWRCAAGFEKEKEKRDA